VKALLISTDWQQNDYRVANNAYGGVTYYRLIAPQKAVNAIGHDFEYLGNKQSIDGKTWEERLSGVDIVISKHIDNPNGAKNLHLACQKLGIPFVYDLDDDLFSIRADNPAHESYAKGQMKRIYLATNLSFANALFVSTEPLKEVYQKFFRENFNLEIPIFVLPNFNDAELFNFKSPKNEDKVVIGYHGSVTHDADLALILPIIDKLMYIHPKLYMQLVGTVRKDSIDKLFAAIKNKHRFEIKAGTPAFDKFPELLMSMRWDIGVAPLIDDEFNHGKSHIKYMEYAMKHIPVVASDVYPYTRHAKEALLCRNTTDWFQKLHQLIRDKKYRFDTARKIHEHVMSDCQYRDKGQLWVDAAQTVIKNYKEKHNLV
jgi:hypothetical protein